MRDKTHEDFIDRWAEFVKENPREVWIKELKPFINGQIKKANRFYEKLSQTKKGREKIKQLRNHKV